MSAQRVSVRAVLLDAMGTLLHLEPPAPALVRGLRERHGVAVSVERAERAFGAEMRYYRAHHQTGRDARSLHELRLRCAGVLGEMLGEAAVSIPPEVLVHELLAALRFSAFADAPPALRELRARGLRLVVVSNWDCSLAQVLARTGLAALLDGVVTSAQAGASKPAPQIFATALRQAGVDASAALHVGDDLDHDVGGARAAGIRALLIDRDGAIGGRDGTPADQSVISTLSELSRLAA